ncbi:MAG: DUF1553 domain-containing protein [Acidobacteria bacterium]|nr:DUF1553 domain-containing protein [Acidobacteriota bacterium]
MLRLAVSFCFLLSALPLTAATALEYFETEVRPLLAEKCFGCHTQTKMGGLSMASRQDLLAGGASGPAIEPKAPERSLLIQVVKHEHERIQMPPGGKLEDEEIAKLVRWVDAGAVWPDSAAAAPKAGDKYEVTDEQRRYWAFQPVKAPTGDIDQLIDAKLVEKGLQKAGPADARTWLRRVSFDLIGLPPTPAEVDAFVADPSPAAREKVVDRLLASPRYGERWGRLWLDVARYSDERLNSTQDEPFPNAFRYRDWVIQAFNDDLPYDLFVKAHLAADQLEQQDLAGHTREELAPALGMYGLSPKFQDDRIDVTGRGFLAMTIACAQCHDHKFDPIPTEDYYALLGVFNSTKTSERPLADQAVVQEYESRRKAADEAKGKLNAYLAAQAHALVDAFAGRTSDYLMAARELLLEDGKGLAAAASREGLDPETLERWRDYLGGSPREHLLLDEWDALLARKASKEEFQAFADGFQTKLQEVIAERRRMEKENEIRLGGDDSAGKAARTELLSLPREEYFLWRDVASGEGHKLPVRASTGVLYYDGKAIERFLAGPVADYVTRSRAQVAELEAAVPEKYPFLHVISDVAEPKNGHVYIRGNADNLGDEVPRRFLTVLCNGEPKPFTQGSGRLELARAIADEKNPLTARVMANRIWAQHFGRGIVGTPSNFGQMGERPSNPELLDYLAARFVAGGWSVKALHREILLSDAYGREATDIAANHEIDPDNKLLWRYNRRRLDVEALRDAMLFVAGTLDSDAGGPPVMLDEESNHRRTVYGYVSRRRLDNVLGLFDFPNPNNTSERRVPTNTPMQGLFFLNSELAMAQAEALVQRAADEAGEAPAKRIERMYRLLFGREATAKELSLTQKFLAEEPNGWPLLAQSLLSSNEFLYVD